MYIIMNVFFVNTPICVFDINKHFIYIIMFSASLFMMNYVSILLNYVPRTTWIFCEMFSDRICFVKGTFSIWKDMPEQTLYSKIKQLL